MTPTLTDPQTPVENAAILAFNQGNAHFREARWAQAQACYTQALTLDAQLEVAALQLARCMARQGDGMAARERFRHLLQAFPRNYSGWLEAGHLCRQQGATDQAQACFNYALQIAPERFEARLALTRLLEDGAQMEAAAGQYLQALAAAEANNRHFVHWRMAKYRLERGDAARALEALRQALLQIGLYRVPIDDNEFAEMQTDLGDVLMRLGMLQEAQHAFSLASAATAEATLVRLADISFRYNLWQEAHEILRRNVALHPKSANAHWNLAHSLAESWNMQEALLVLEQAEALAPQPGALSMRASVAGRTGDAQTALAHYLALAEAEGPRSKMNSSAAMSALYSDKLSAEEVSDLHLRLFQPLGANARSAASFANERQSQKRIRLGLLTADFHAQHPVNLFMQPVLARLDPLAIEVSVYFTGVSYDEQTRLAKQRVAHWIEVTTLSDVQLARRIEDDGIDILLDLAGHTGMQRVALLGQRAAPVQATFLGYPGSTGVPNVDWIIADPVVAPVGREALFSEQVVRLPHTVFCYAPEADYPYPEFTAAHAERPLTFGSFNNVPKLTPHTVNLWAAVLKAVPDARLLLKAPSFKDAGAVASFTQRFVDAGIGADRLEFRGPSALPDMMDEYADVDIALDTAPYNGGTTSLQALWMGAPVLVKAGDNFVSRMGASFMHAAGLPEWVASDDDEYVAIAVRMAGDRQGLLSLKQSLRQRLQSCPGWDIEQYTRDFERALRSMWRAAC